MKKYYQKLLILGVFLSVTFVFGQFNTLKPIVPKNESKISLNSENTEKTEFNKDEKSKENPKKEMDSLKTLMKDFTSFNNQKWNLQNSKDSLILNTQTKIFENRNTQKTVQNQEKVPFGQVELATCGAFMPLKSGLHITSPFGSRIHPIFGTRKSHNGIDLKAHYENVFSVMDGIVTASGWDPKGGGNYIKINHFGRFETAYLHLSEIYYKVGERVKAGFIIAKSGNTGNSTGPHLHFSVREFGQLINPTHFLNDLIKVNNLIATHYAK